MRYHCFSQRPHVAQKAHRCAWCGHPVLSGSTYIRERSVYEGYFQNHAWHEACRKDADDYYDYYGGGDFPGSVDMPFFALYQLEARALNPKGGDSDV